MSKQETSSARTKHIDVQYHLTRQLAEQKTIILEYCPTTEMIADGFTKSLNASMHKKFAASSGLAIKGGY